MGKQVIRIALNELPVEGLTINRWDAGGLASQARESFRAGRELHHPLRFMCHISENTSDLAQ
jgi:hypothetical protein